MIPQAAALTRSSLAAATNSDTVWYRVITDWLALHAIAVGLTIVIAVVTRMVLSRLIRRVTDNATRKARKERPGMMRSSQHTAELTDVVMNQRREQRAEAMGQLLRSAMTFFVYGTATLIIFTQLGVNIGPLLASAGVIGVALGFGAQTLVKDFLSGIFLVVEDQFGIGDFVDLGPAIGTVEEVTLRITRVRDTSGVVWYVRNGEILRVGNRSQGWTMAVVDVPVSYDEDLDRVRALVEKLGADMDGDSAYDGILFGTPTYAGVESVAGDAVFIRVTCKAAPDQQLQAGREIRERLKTTFDRAGVRMPILARAAVPGTPGVAGPAAPAQSPSPRI